MCWASSAPSTCQEVLERFPAVAAAAQTRRVSREGIARDSSLIFMALVDQQIHIKKSERFVV